MDGRPSRTVVEQVPRRLRPRRSPPLDGAAPWRARYPQAQPAGSLAARFWGCLRSARELHQHPQRLDDGAGAHRAAADRSKAAFAMQNAAVARGDREMHETHRLARRGTAWTGDAGNGDGEVDAGTLQRAHGHRGRGLLADRAKALERRGLDPEHRPFGLIRISDKTAVDDVGGAGNVSKRASDQTPGAGFRGRDG